MAVFASRKLAPPVITAESKTFFDAARQGRLLIPICTACDRAHWYPRVICPFCASDKVEWREASGKGTIYTFQRHAPRQGALHNRPCDARRRTHYVDQYRRLRRRRRSDRPGGRRCIFKTRIRER